MNSQPCADCLATFISTFVVERVIIQQQVRIWNQSINTLPEGGVRVPPFQICPPMAPRPAKRQRRSTVVSDGSDGDIGLSSSKPGKSNLQREITLDGRTSTTASPVKSTKARPTSRKAAVRPSPTSSPEKTRKNAKGKVDPEKNNSLHNFFGRATEDQRWRKKSQTPDVEVDCNVELSDAIEDDELSDETLQVLGIKTEKTNHILDRRKISALSAPAAIRSNNYGGSLPSSQRFVKRTAPAQKATSTHPDSSEAESHRTWADRYGPTNLEELMVHRKKVADVQSWLQGKIDGRNGQKLLVLKGPAGSGKTTTIVLLAKAMALHLVPWHNPAISEAGANNTTSTQFDDFLKRGGQFGSLPFEQESSNSIVSEDEDHRLLVIEEFPSSMTRSSSALQSFRSVILQFLSRGKPASTIALPSQHGPKDTSPPVIMVISETLLSSSTALSDSFTAHRLLGPDILNHPFVTAMDFNPVAPTLITKALDLVMKKEARDSRRRRMPGPAIMSRLAEMGDVRSAVNSLEFLCLRGGDGMEWSGTVAAKLKRTSKDSVMMTENEKKSLALVSQRETTLDMFHAAGKIVYNKREDPQVLDTRSEPPPKPPDHMMHLYTPKVSQVNIEALLSETGTDIQTFISTVHENYIISCNSDKFVDIFDACSDILSVSDILNPENRPNRHGHSSNPNAGILQYNLQAGSSDTLRQDEISFNVATRGLLFHLPYPVKRAAARVTGWKQGDEYKMFYPASLRLWKPIEEMQGLLEMFVYNDRITGMPSKATSSAIGGDGGVATWPSRSLGMYDSARTIKSEPTDSNTLYPAHLYPQVEDAGPPPPLKHGKDTLILEILPYMTRISSARKQDTSTLEKITKLKPKSFLSTADESFDEEDETSSDLKTAVAIGGANAVHGRLGVGFGGATQSMMPDDPSAGVEKLYISEDDIEDD